MIFKQLSDIKIAALSGYFLLINFYTKFSAVIKELQLG